MRSDDRVVALSRATWHPLPDIGCLVVNQCRRNARTQFTTSRARRA